jgi:DMATS type aromatic prenyltransferase
LSGVTKNTTVSILYPYARIALITRSKKKFTLYKKGVAMTASENISTVFDSIDLACDDMPISLEERPDIARQSQVGFDPEKLVPTQTYVECGIEKLTALCHSVGLSNKIEQITEIFRTLTSSWGKTAVGSKTTWKSDVSDDCSPFEFSIALDPNKAELRVLVEAQGRNPNLQSNWQAGLELNQQLAAKYNVNLDRFEQIADLFAPTDSEAKFSIWHSACFYLDKEPAFKLYVNPQAQSKSKAAAIVEESLVRLGFDRVWPTLAETAAQRGPDKDEFIYFSLDLAAHAQARVKVYLRHHNATPAELESALSAANNYVAGDAIEFCQAMAPGQTLFAQKPVGTCFSLIQGANSVPSFGTLYLPICNYASDDRVVCDRLNSYLAQHSFPSSVYTSTLESFATRSLDTGIGMQSYTSFRREQEQMRVAVYLNPEINAVRSSITYSLPSVEEMVCQYYDKNTLAHHPLVQRLQREPANPQHIWLLFMNFHELVNHFTRLLAIIVARVEDERIRCLLAKQLNEELGNGQIEHNHKQMFDRLIINIEPWRMDSFTDDMLIPGKEFTQRLDEIYSDSNPYVGVGAGILMEIQAEQFDVCLANECRKTDIDLSAIAWLILHEEIEVNHANDSVIVARLADDSPEGKLGAIEGARKARVATWRLLDRLYRICYGASPATV